MSEVDSVGGFVKQYSIVVDPARMRAQGVTLSEIGEAVRISKTRRSSSVTVPGEFAITRGAEHPQARHLHRRQPGAGSPLDAREAGQRFPARRRGRRTVAPQRPDKALST
ncbi:MAG: hypothetical protein M9939_22740 [Mesorhizobium sp.]|nr:hypothetical protein [Mesorhizobium sp.]MCO5163941.1 hypothetical protein [Mesorhizobium sp.]